MTDTPINRERVERLADFLQDEDLHEEAQRHVAETLLSLRDALDEAEAERHRWRQAAAKGSLHTQADLDRAVAEARAVALREAAAYHQRHAEGYAKIGQEMDHKRHVEYARAILALIGTPAAEALERVRAEEREACFSAAEYVSDGRIAALQADSAEADDPYGDGLLDEAVSLSAEMLAAIRARGEM